MQEVLHIFNSLSPLFSQLGSELALAAAADGDGDDDGGGDDDS